MLAQSAVPGLKRQRASGAPQSGAPRPDCDVPDYLGDVAVDAVPNSDRIGFSVPFNLKEHESGYAFVACFCDALKLGANQSEKWRHALTLTFAQMKKESNFRSWIWMHGSTLIQNGLLMYYPRVWLQLTLPSKEAVRVFWSGGQLRIENFSAANAVQLIQALSTDPRFKPRYITPASDVL